MSSGEFDDDPFVVGLEDGIVRTNVYFQEDQEGYIEFVVKVADPWIESYYHLANMSVRKEKIQF